MSNIKNGSTVTLHYTGTLEDGSTFDSSRNEGREPLSFVVGEGQVIPGFENAVLGKSKGDTVNVTIEPEDAYGNHEVHLVVPVPLDRMPQGITEGAVLQTMTEQGPAIVTVRNIDTQYKFALVDHNHPLAGKQLTFDIEIVDVAEAVEIVEAVEEPTSEK